jgi:Uma2 family endonuclease
MSQLGAVPAMTYAEYLGAEDSSDQRHEFWNGEMFSMSGGSFAHSQIAANLIYALMRRLDGSPCRVYTSDTRVRAEGSTNAAYPDVVIICGAPAAHSNDKNAATNPRVVAEILSNSSEMFDRGDKFAYYRQFPSLQTYVLVSQHRKRIEVFERGSNDDLWILRITEQGQFRIGNDLAVAMDDVYKNVEIV